MKFVKRISLFFIYPMTMFSLGFASYMAIDEFFYPGDMAGGTLLQEKGNALVDTSGNQGAAFEDSDGNDVNGFSSGSGDSFGSSSGSAAAEESFSSGSSSSGSSYGDFSYGNSHGSSSYENSSYESSAYGGLVGEEAQLLNQGAANIWQDGAVAAGYAKDPVVSANTSYIIASYDMVSGDMKEEAVSPPDKYIGLTRQRLEEELKEYEKSPSLVDLEKGFSHVELVSFSPDKVVIRKSFAQENKNQGFFLVNENHQVIVYDESLSYVYMDTGIKAEKLPEELQKEILFMKYIETESELYNFLESYSS